jgi:hypothetical protein
MDEPKHTPKRLRDEVAFWLLILGLAALLLALPGDVYYGLETSFPPPITEAESK